jgi:hypothetical protein
MYVSCQRYAFNALQRSLLPRPYRPPTATLTLLLESIAKRDS